MYAFSVFILINMVKIIIHAWTQETFFINDIRSSQWYKISRVGDVICTYHQQNNHPELFLYIHSIKCPLSDKVISQCNTTYPEELIFFVTQEIVYIVMCFIENHITFICFITMVFVNSFIGPFLNVYIENNKDARLRGTIKSPKIKRWPRQKRRSAYFSFGLLGFCGGIWNLEETSHIGN